jgi:uncharacterized RDD family membrane protein YckC
MHVHCSRCGSTIEFADKRPLFCAYCGHALDDTTPPAAACDPEAVTRTAPPAAATGAAPETVGGYRLLRSLGSGGMGTVFEAEETASGRRVALKLVSADSDATPEALERFRQEGRLASAIAHPRCVFVLAANEEAGRPYIVMELMSGQTLEDLVAQRGTLPPEEAVAKILDVIEGLQEAHKRGVIHRDVKPSNCFLEVDGRVKVGDFGLSKSLVRDTRLTKTGSFMGTPLYASPEQVRAEKLDALTDLYSVAATLYYLLTGRAPHQTGDAMATLAAIVADPAPPLRRWRPELSAALDKVVLRALERDRQRRYRDLEEFRRALLPFAPGRLSIGGMGIRLGAYAIDYVLMALLSSPAILLQFGKRMEEMFDPGSVVRNLQYQWFGLLIWLLYYAVLEGVWGCSVGKWLVGLRVQTPGGDSPGLARAFLRTVVFLGLVHLGLLVSQVILLVYLPREATWQELMLYTNLINLVNLFGLAGGLALLLGPMRARNGYRGLHEFASGTRVVRLPAVPKRKSFPTRSPDRDLLRADGLAARLGHFTVAGELRGGEERILLGSDPVLGRTVWIWIRPLGEPPVPASRRELGRATRLRWLEGGQQASEQWDAFLAPAGSSLPEVSADEGRLSWPDARSLLEQLLDELVAAGADGTLPACLGVDQVWVQPNGDVQLLDFAPNRSPHPDEVPRTADKTGDSPALALFRQAVAWALEGRPPSAAGGAPRALVPLHARDFLERLYAPRNTYHDVKDVQAALQATRDRLTEVTRLRRLAQMAMCLAFIFLGPCFGLVGAAMLPTFSSVSLFAGTQMGELTLQDLEEGASRDFLATMLNPHPLVHVKAALQLDQDRVLGDRLAQTLHRLQQQREVRLRSSSRFGWLAFISGAERSAEQRVRLDWEKNKKQRRLRGITFRQDANWFHEPPDIGAEVFWITVVGLLIWLALAVVWAFGWRGGLSYRLAGLALVRENGEPAARWRCAWRQLVLWAPVIGLFVVSAWAETRYWSLWTEADAAWLLWLSWGAWWAAPVWLVGCAVLALWFPARSPHDRLAGIYVVPR